MESAMRNDPMWSSIVNLRLGCTSVRVSLATLSANGWTSRKYALEHKHDITDDEEFRSESSLEVSAVLSVHGTKPPYLLETMRFMRASGLSHVYLGVFNEEVLGTVREELKELVGNAFVSLIEMDAWPNMRWSKVSGFSDLAWKSIINDLALYHSKSWDDLLVVHDYDELVVPTEGALVPAVLKQFVAKAPQVNADLTNLCYFLLCPALTIGSLRQTRQAVSDNKISSRAEDFPLMDGGARAPERDSQRIPCVATQNCSDSWDYCADGGYANMFPKYIAVVRNVYKTAIHAPGHCSIVDYASLPADLAELGALPRETFVVIGREEGLIVQHFAELFGRRGRHIRDLLRGHATVPSAYTTIWAPRLAADEYVD
eukprot:TRINITY_DN46131_c0_g1_i1.p1 TRINITY_DN46131_c0_g1~~TRINITY_DN46131_c0_g1_i1.p1  ORF type:complete len:421 (+),score=63.32 TRINITY_DN46131_c0_g1_i1:150-1265(+)